MTAACDGQIRLWDIRARTCARAFEGHVNRTQKIGNALTPSSSQNCKSMDVNIISLNQFEGMQFSPCMRYIACGSEDKMAYVYDIRQSSFVERCVDAFVFLSHNFLLLNTPNKHTMLVYIHYCRLQGGSDVVTEVAYNPVYSQLAVANQAGKCMFYTCN